MNNILELKGKRFIQESKKNPMGGVTMNGKVVVTTSHLERLNNQLNQINDFWKNEKRTFEGLLISVVYNKIAAKSNRISGLFKGKYSNQSIVGAKFSKDKNKHIITYYLDPKDIEKSTFLVEVVKTILNIHFEGRIDQTTFVEKGKILSIPFNKYSISMSTFKQVIADLSYIESFELEIPSLKLNDSIITLYDLKIDLKKVLKDIGIDVLNTRILDNQTVLLDKNQLELLSARAPYLVSMSTENISNFSPTDFKRELETGVTFIPQPGIEPTIGVIDTLFDESVYFSEWVDYHDMVAEGIERRPDDFRHGTAISSIIVDGSRLNPWLDDGCGRFKVRHFGVAIGSKFSSFSIIKSIKEIVSNNKDIKVWNISLGSNQEINDNFISAEASVLDQIQFENDVIFVVAGTNKPSEDIVKIGSPADSINSMVVNAVTKSGISTNYSRKGLALSFFAKPDVCYYGGSGEKYIKVREPLEEAEVAGTSYAAPWIARKLSYLIDILGLNRELSKALIIDSARGWNTAPEPEQVALYGHGVVPIKIEDVIKSYEDEIKFLVTDISEKWNTYNYHFPVPLHNERYPFVSRATMCYFPLCNRTQGVDYTNTELNLHFGRIKDNGKLVEINDDNQNRDEDNNSERHYILEGDARKKFRKWDNVKYITELPKDNKKSKQAYTNKNWGMEIKTNDRLNKEDGVGVRFGVVVTIKEINGINRIEEFIKNCILNGWLVNEINVKLRVDINQKINETIEFES